VIDHLTVTVRDLKKTRAFYLKALKPLGYVPMIEYPGAVAFGDSHPVLWFRQGKKVTTPQHLALVAKSRAAVDAFHKAALKAGAKDDGAPGLRAEYHPHYYGAFVVDLNGHPIEAVYHRDPKKKG
jgi:predicted lactoylglutathione lyase